MIEYVKERFNRYNEVVGVLLDDVVLASMGCKTATELKSKSKDFRKKAADALQKHMVSITLEVLKEDQSFLFKS